MVGSSLVNITDNTGADLLAAPVKRQNIVTNIDVSVPAMTDSQGNVVPFDATKVYLAAKANGL